MDCYKRKNGETSTESVRNLEGLQNGVSKIKFPNPLTSFYSRQYFILAQI